MITRVRVKNFRSLADVDVTLGPLTVLIGRNGAGKSAFLDVLSFLNDSLQLGVGLQAAISKRGGMAFLRRLAPDDVCHDMAITVTVEVEGSWSEYGFVLDTCADNEVLVKHEFCRIGKNEADAEIAFIADAGTWTLPPVNPFMPGSIERVEMRITSDQLFLQTLSMATPASNLSHWLMMSDIYNFFPDLLRKPQSVQTDTILTVSGANFASVLMRMKNEGKIGRIVSALKIVVPDIKDITVEYLNDYLFVKLLHDDYSSGERWFLLEQESEGTIRLLALLIALWQHSDYTLVALEEPELYLYARSMALLSGVIKEASLSQQIVLTTQSPDFISEFSIDQFRIVERKQGATHIGPLLPEQLDAINKELFTTGDLLRIEGLRTTPFEAVGVDNA